MRIGLMGTRGIPASYGGFETFYENLAPRLVERGHEVTVYNRPHAISHPSLQRYRGVRLINLPSIQTKHLDTISHTALSVLHGLTQRYDIVYICGPGNTPLAWLPRLLGARVVLNVDGADWKRAKWGRFASRYLHAVERFATWAADVVVADNGAVQSRFREEYGAAVEFVPYGANVLRNEGLEHVQRHGLAPRRYVLWVGRIEPEARIEELISAFKALAASDLRLVILGDAPFAREYKAYLRGLADERVVFTGFQFGAAYQQLSCHALVYVQTSPTSGTSPALLDQMGFGNAVIARGTPTNRETVGGAGLVYPPDNPIEGLAACLRSVIEDPALTERLRKAAVGHVRAAYSWEHITNKYETMFLALCGRPASAPGL